MDEQKRQCVLMLWNRFQPHREMGKDRGTCCSVVSAILQGRKPTIELIDQVGELNDFFSVAFVTQIAYIDAPQLNGNGWLGKVQKKFYQITRSDPSQRYISPSFYTGHILGLLQLVGKQGAYEAEFSKQLIMHFPSILVQLNNRGELLDNHDFSIWSEQVSQLIKEWLRLMEIVHRNLIGDLILNIRADFRDCPELKIYRPVDTIMANIFHSRVEKRPAPGRFKLFCLASELERES